MGLGRRDAPGLGAATQGVSVLLDALDRARARAGSASALRHGTEVVSFDRVLSRVEERARQLAEPGKDRFVTLDAEDPIAFLVDFLAARLAARPALVNPPGTPSVLRARREESVRASAVRSDETVFFSSGSVGAGKAVPLSDSRLLFAALALPDGASILPEDRVAIGVPVGHVFGLVRGALNALAIGAEAVFWSPRRDPVGEASQWGATIALLSAPQIALSANREDPARLRGVLSGGAPVAERILRAVEARGAPVRLGWGLTETAGLGSRQRLDRPRRPGTVGPPAPGMRVEVVSADSGSRAPGETGEIRVAGPATFEGYLDAGEARPFDPSGHLRTGDLGYLDETGELVVRGRVAYAVRTRGRWVCAEELEAAAREHPGVSEAAAVPLPQRDSFALLLETAESSASFRRSMREFLVRRLPAFARPRTLIFRSEIPRGPGGKVDRPEAFRSIDGP